MPDENAMLKSYRVLDLTNETGSICGKVLAELGADVIKIEKPSGDTARDIGPFWHNIPHPEKSLHWFASNIGKRSITLDIDKAEGRKILKRLIGTADIIVESFPPGYLAELGLDYSSLATEYPRLIMASITPYGETGPYKEYKAYDLQLQAMSGTAYVCGFPDEAPLVWGGLQAYYQAGLQAAVGTMIALWHREMQGEGQHISLSIREAMTTLTTTDAPVANWVENKTIKQRRGSSQEDLEGGILKWFYPCKDGFVIHKIALGVFGHMTNSLVAWMNEEGMSEGLHEQDFSKYGFAEVSQDQITTWEGVIAKFFLTKTKNELLEGALSRSIIIYPMSSISEVVSNAQLQSRNYWTELHHPELDSTITYPGALFKSNETSPVFRLRPPLIGEHNDAIYTGELSFPASTLNRLRKNKVI